jgi:hypothetical protein
VVESKEYDLSIDTLYSFNLSSLSGYYGCPTVVANKPDDKRHVDAPVKPVYSATSCRVCRSLPARSSTDVSLPQALNRLHLNVVEAAAWSQCPESVSGGII